VLVKLPRAGYNAAQSVTFADRPPSIAHIAGFQHRLPAAAPAHFQ
jgi:hypothetical protein